MSPWGMSGGGVPATGGKGVTPEGVESLGVSCCEAGMAVSMTTTVSVIRAGGARLSRLLVPRAARFCSARA